METLTRPVLIALAGNPNTGKTTLFNQLTGSSAKVGNYPGVTVERHEGLWPLPGREPAKVVDVPGTYSLAARSEEEQLAVRAVAGLDPLDHPNVVIVVVDASQLSRNLYLAVQILELGVPVVIALNMVDVLAEHGQEIDEIALAARLGAPVVRVVASKGVGIRELGAAVTEILDPRPRMSEVSWVAEGSPLEADVSAVASVLPESWHRGVTTRRNALALWAIQSVDDDDELEQIPDALRARVKERLARAYEDCREIDEEIVRSRYAWIDQALSGVVRQVSDRKVSLTDRLDRVLLHPLFGFAIFVAVMTVVFQSLFSGADPAISLIESAFSVASDHLRQWLPEGLFADFIVQGVVAGVGGVLVFLPQILLLFFFIGLMEDSGYMARVAYLMDRVMKAIGLHGRAFVPMLSGFACAVPAVLATRTMERKRDRLLTMMVVPLMTCSARLPVYGLLIAAFAVGGGVGSFTQGLLMVGMYLFSVLIALVAAAVLGRTVLKGPRVPLLMEMPPYRMPHFMTVIRRMWERSGVFVREAGTVILVCTVLMWFLLAFPRTSERSRALGAERERVVAERAQLDASSATAAALEVRIHDLGAEEAGARLRDSYGGRLGRVIEPVLRPLGFDWKIGVGILGAFAAREVFVSTMAVVYGLDAEEDETSSALRDRIRTQRHPDGTAVYTPVVCLSLMVFFALACQCMSTLAVVKRETRTWRWPAFLFAYMTTLAWVASFVVYQGGRLFGLT